MKKAFVLVAASLLLFIRCSDNNMVLDFNSISGKWDAYVTKVTTHFKDYKKKYIEEERILGEYVIEDNKITVIKNGVHYVKGFSLSKYSIKISYPKYEYIIDRIERDYIKMNTDYIVYDNSSPEDNNQEGDYRRIIESVELRKKDKLNYERYIPID